MDDNYIHQPGYFESMCEVISGLDPKAADFDFMFGNLRAMANHSPFLTGDERKQVKAMLHVVVQTAQSFKTQL